MSYLFARRADRREIRTARLLVGDELHTVWLHLSLLAENGETPNGTGDETAHRFLPSAEWQEYKAILTRAGALDDEAWVALSMHMHNVQSLRHAVFTLAPRARLAPTFISSCQELAAVAGTLYTELTGRSPMTGDRV